MVEATNPGGERGVANQGPDKLVDGDASRVGSGLTPRSRRWGRRPSTNADAYASAGGRRLVPADDRRRRQRLDARVCALRQAQGRRPPSHAPRCRAAHCSPFQQNHPPSTPSAGTPPSWKFGINQPRRSNFRSIGEVAARCGPARRRSSNRSGAGRSRSTNRGRGRRRRRVANVPRRRRRARRRRSRPASQPAVGVAEPAGAAGAPPPSPSTPIGSTYRFTFDRCVASTRAARRAWRASSSPRRLCTTSAGKCSLRRPRTPAAPGPRRLAGLHSLVDGDIFTKMV